LRSPQQRAPWPFAATLVCASLLGIVLAFCARTVLPAWALDGEFFPSSVCSSGNSAASPQAARTGD
jgi:flagellar biosynthesis protein FliR